MTSSSFRFLRMSSEVLESKRKIERTCRNICIHNKIAPFRKYAKPSVSISINYDDTCRHKKNNEVDVQLSFHLFSKSKSPSAACIQYMLTIIEPPHDHAATELFPRKTVRRPPQAKQLPLENRYLFNLSRSCRLGRKVII